MANKNPTPAKPTTTAAKPATKPAAPLPAPKPAPVQEPDIDEDLDDDDVADGEANDDTLTKVGDIEYDPKKMYKLPFGKRIAVRLGALVSKAVAYREKIDQWQGDEVAQVRVTLDRSIADLKHAATEMARLPDDYKPRIPKGSGGGKASAATPLEAGQMIKIVEKKKEEYQDILEAMEGIEVIETRGNKVLSKLPDGTKILLPRGHVCVQAAA